MTCAGGAACVDVPYGQQEVFSCSQLFKVCNGKGQCLSDYGGYCASDSDCANGNCGGDTCCNIPFPCQECEGGDGNFSAYTPAGQNGVGCRAATNACDGYGACKLAKGQPCTAGFACASGVCTLADGGSGTCN